MKVFSTDVAVFATLYILAESEEEAEAKAREAIGNDGIGLEFSSRREMIGEDLWMTGETFNSDMPELSLSPAMTIAPMERQANVFQIDLSDELGGDD